MSEFFAKVYDQETKERFLDYIIIDKYPRRWWERLFEKSVLLENKYNKDLYNFTTGQIQELYKLLNLSLESLIVLNINLTKYGDWASINGLLVDGQNHYNEFDTEMLNLCASKSGLKQSIVTRDEFNKMIKEFDNYQDKFIYYCLFEGIKGKGFCDVINLKVEDIDINNKMVNLNSGKTIKVSQEFIDVCFKADVEKIYVTPYNPIGLIPSINILKPKKNSVKDCSERTIQRTFARMRDSKKINANSIFNSGLIVHLNERAEELGIHVKELIYQTDTWNDIKEKYNVNMNTRSRFLLKYEDFLL